MSRTGRSRPGILMLGLLAALLYAGFNWVQSIEMATLHTGVDTPDRHGTPILLVEDPPFVWVRVERPEPGWIGRVEANSRVRIDPGPDVVYDAQVWEDDPRVDGLFRERYGLLRHLAASLWQEDPVTLRLQRVY